MGERGLLARLVTIALVTGAIIVGARGGNALAAPPRRCCACLMAWDVRAPSGARPGMAYYMISVKRPFSEMAPITDPQSWSTCNPGNFLASWVAAPDACTTGNTDPAASPPTKGTSWSAPLFEHFRVVSEPRPGCDPNESRFRNLLDIQSVRAATSYRYDYGLCRSIDHRVDCSDGSGGITWDCGFTTVQASGAGSVVKGVKYLRFADGLGLNNWVEAGLRAMVDDIVDNEVCCGLSGPVQCPTCTKPLHIHVDPVAPLCPAA